ncbi:MAG: alpha-1,4-glucan--maltose-1-phosphate maltosyltransferase [Gammaproteobacteria bacterium]|nr:alpha-1,4-glucan--maltose-1-phosphate maltosyltransferase [Gammaproteobacteria bacterium]
MAKPVARSLPAEARQRVVIETLTPQVDGGRYPIKRVVGEKVGVEVDAFTDGHDAIMCVLRYQYESEGKWFELPMVPLGNDRWAAFFSVSQTGFYRYSVCAWVDHFESWRRDLGKRIAVNEDTELDYRAGAALVAAAAARATGKDASHLEATVRGLSSKRDASEKRTLAQDEELSRLMYTCADRRFETHYGTELRVRVDRERARFGAWYEFFPRSFGGEGQHGSFKTCMAQLEYVARMGFDVVYLPPVHPIGHSFRKGKNNILAATADDVGSPWAIGSKEGGHKSLHPELGTLEDFSAFRKRAEALGMELALDIAFQCAPDHPYVKEHPEWFRKRPDGSIQYAENPPKKYQDIYPFDFETEAWEGLWQELKSVFQFWIDQGVYIFRVDNPHTKSFAFWEWVIDEITRKHPEVIFLAEAFTRPKVMHCLAKLGFSQSYTYFTWRNTRGELTEYFTELASSESREYFRPNVWPNTPDILSEYLQYGGRPAFMIRQILAATLSANYGIYGPAFELADDQTHKPGAEEYNNSEKYQLMQWDTTRTDSLSALIARLNSIRRDNAALQSDWSLQFHGVDNDNLLCYSKAVDDASEVILVVVNLDPYHTQSGWIDLPPARFGITGDGPYQMHDLLTDVRYLWHGARNYVQLDPHAAPAHVFRLRRHVHNERDFDYYL